MRFRQVHLDFHTSEKIPDIGKDFDKKEFQDALKKGHVDSITVFSKCHHGWAYHPSKANEMHPNLKFDLLKAEIEAAHEINVKTPVYLSAGFDEKAAVKHHDWLRCPDGNEITDEDFEIPKYHELCMNTPYLDYLLEQIKETAANYDADGIFLDIVGVKECKCKKCTADMKALGMNPEDSADVRKFAEKTYANYTKRVRETIDSVKPGLPVFHNGGHIQRGRHDLAHMNSHLEIESLPTGGWGYDHFPISARYVQQLGMEYLGMTGKFHKSWGEFGGFKHPNAIRYEVALSVMNGAKCSIGDQLHPFGKMDSNTYRIIGEGYKEIEEKEPWLDNVNSVADIGLLSVESVQNVNGGNATTQTGVDDAGAGRILLEGHYLFDVLDTESDFEKYKLIILPDNIRLYKTLEEKLKKYVSNGGKILASGDSALNENDEFALDFGVKNEGVNPYNPDYVRPNFEIDIYDTTSFLLYSDGRKISLNGGKELAIRENPFFNRTAEHFCSHIHTPTAFEYGGPGIAMGKDGIYIAWKIFTEYATVGSIICKKLVMHAIDLLLGDGKSLSTTLPAQGITTVMEQKGKKRYISHMLYASPVKRGTDTEIIEDIIPLYNIKAEYEFDNDIKNVYLAPSMEKLEFEKHDGKVSVIIPKIECHQMIVFDY